LAAVVGVKPPSGARGVPLVTVLKSQTALNDGKSMNARFGTHTTRGPVSQRETMTPTQF